MSNPADPSRSPEPHRRRPRYLGKHPRHFAEKYKERDPGRYPETVARVISSGKTPAGAHLPIMVSEVLAALDPQPGESAVDCTLGYGGHARALLERLLPGGRLLGIDVDPGELSRTEERLRSAGFAPEAFSVHRSNFAAVATILAGAGLETVNLLFADLGVSSMQLDDPARGFSFKADGPLDMRMNPLRGRSASALLESIAPADLARLLVENADESRASEIAARLAGRRFSSTQGLAAAIREAAPLISPDRQNDTIRRVFQAIRIEVNDEFGALDSLLRALPHTLAPAGRAAILSFHSGEDRRVKRAFEQGLRDGHFSALSDAVIRPSPAERGANPRSSSARLRWARRGRAGGPAASIIPAAA